MFCKEQPDIELASSSGAPGNFGCLSLLAGARMWMAFAWMCLMYFSSMQIIQTIQRKFGLRGFDRQRHLYDIDQPEMLPLLEEVRQLLDSYPERYAVGETFLSNPTTAAAYTGPRLLHASFNFEFMAWRWHPGLFLRAIQRWENALQPDAWPNYVLNNHDVRRSASRYGKGEDDERLKVAAALPIDTARHTLSCTMVKRLACAISSLTRAEVKIRSVSCTGHFIKGGMAAARRCSGAISKMQDSVKAEPWLPGP
jgi:alpha-glucosidase